MIINALTAIDFYKADHRRQYPKGTQRVYSNFTPRSAKLAVTGPGFDQKVVFFGLQYFIKDFLIDDWNTTFFYQDKKIVVATYKRRMDLSLGPNAISMDHIEQLHDLGHLPLHIKALEEGSRVNIGVPLLTVQNTRDDFFWLTNYIESVLSCYLWKPITSATTAYECRRILKDYAVRTGSDLGFVSIQCHDFSFRGMASLQDAAVSGAAHLTAFVGSDTVCAIDFIEDYYCSDSETRLIGGSVPATEHSVMCMGGEEDEINTFRRLITVIYPSGVISIVSDTWDFWKVITEYLVELKNEIMHRKGKVVIRPDSGDPVKIICGDPAAPVGTPEYKGAVECLFEIFGGTTTSTGHKVLDQHIGLIYGDSITLDKMDKILGRLMEKGFASRNIVFGVGSFTYQYCTRDNFGFAMKATSGVVNNVRRDIFKNPKTDDGTKRSAKGLLRVEKEGNNFVLFDQQTEEQEKKGELKSVFLDGKITREVSFQEIRDKLR